MPVPNTFGTATSAIPLSDLDDNFAAPITIGNTAVQLGNTVTTLNNMTLANVTISSGNVTITNVGITNANVSGTANISTLVVVGNATVGGNITAANANVTTNLVLSNGTANGVAYLNVAKVLTTGSALVFDGANLGVGVASPSFRLDVGGGDGTNIALRSTGTANAVFRAYVNSAESGTIGFLNGGGTYFEVAGTEGMRLTSTSLYTASTINVGIGTSSPSQKLDVFSGTASSAVAQFTGVNTGRGLKISTALVNSVNDAGVILDAQQASGVLMLATGGTERARIDASGNLGLGVAPSAWNANNKSIIQLQNTANIFTRSTGLFATSNFVYNSADDGKFQANGYGIVYQQNQTAGTHVWLNTANNTSGANVTASLISAMTLDASGNLLVGTTSANGKLSVSGGAVSSSTFMVDIRNGTYVGLRIRDDGFAVMPSTYDKTVGSAANMYIDSDGVIYRSTSSLKYKTDIKDTLHGLTEVLTLRPVTYKGKSDADAGKIFGGLIAEEVHAAGLTEFVQYAEDGSPDALHYGNMVSLCIKAIQEQQSLIQTLTARITALEGA